MGGSLGAMVAVSLGILVGYWTVTGKMLNIVSAIKGIQPNNNNANNNATSYNPLAPSTQIINTQTQLPAADFFTNPQSTGPQ